jgi:hypothetical protein
LRSVAAAGACWLLASLAVAQPPAQTLDELLARHREAVGGVAAWDAWHSLRLTGKMSAEGAETAAPIVLTSVNGIPGKLRLDFTVQGLPGIVAFDGNSGWMQSPFGERVVQIMSEEQVASWRRQADFAGPLMHPEEKGVSLELVAAAPGEAYRVRVTGDTGAVRTLVLDAESYLVVRQEATAEVQGAELALVSSFADFERTGDLLFARSVESRVEGAPAGQRILIEKAELNVDLPPGFFSTPPGARPPAPPPGPPPASPPTP